MSKMWKSTEHSKVAELYNLKNTLGRGHFAVVKLAEHVFSGEKVAVKVIDKTKMDQISADHLYHEVTCMKLVQHPNVVRLYQVIETQSKLYLILELGDGGDMFDYIMRHDRGLHEDMAKEYFAQIVSAIAYCHKLHVVHRDLKPENVVFFESQGLVKLTDFGFSNRYRPGEKLSTSCGSLAYSAPEILLGEEYDAPAVDVWSLGVILYMLVCGIAPFNEANDSETLINIMDCRYQVHDHVSSNCQDLIQRMLIREPSERIALNEIVDHPWLIGAKSLGRARRNSTPILVRNSISEELHKSIMDTMMQASLANAEEIELALDEDRYDHITSTYFLLAERALLQQETTCSSPHGLDESCSEIASSSKSSSAGKAIPNKLRPMHPDVGNNPAASPMLYSVSPPCKQATLLPPPHLPTLSSDTARRRTTSSSSEESNSSLFPHPKNPSFIREHLTITPRHGFSVAHGGIDALIEEEERCKSQTTTDDEDGGDEFANIINPNVLASHLQRASLQMKRIKKRKSAPVLNEICEESELEGDLHDHSLFRYRNNTHHTGRHSISTSSPSTLRRPPGGGDSHLPGNSNPPVLFGARTGRPLRRRMSNRSSSSENSDDDDSKRESSSNLAGMVSSIFRRRDDASDDDDGDQDGSGGNDRGDRFRYDNDVIVEQDNEATCGGDTSQDDPGKGAEDAGADHSLLNNATRLRIFKKQINLDGSRQTVINSLGIRSRSAESRSSSSYSAVTSSRSCSSARSSCSNLSGLRVRPGGHKGGKWLKNSSSTRSDTGLVLRCHANNARMKCRCGYPARTVRSSSSSSFASLRGDNNLRVCTSLDCMTPDNPKTNHDETRHHRSCSLPRRHRKAKKSKNLLRNQGGTSAPFTSQFEGAEGANVWAGSHESVAMVKRSNLSLASSTCSGSKFVVDPLNELPHPSCLTPLPESGTKDSHLDEERYKFGPPAKPFPLTAGGFETMNPKLRSGSRNSGILTKLNNLKSVSQGNGNAPLSGHYKATIVRKVKARSCCAVM